MRVMLNEWKGAKTLCHEIVIHDIVIYLLLNYKIMAPFFLSDSGTRYLGKRIFWNTIHDFYKKEQNEKKRRDFIDYIAPFHSSKLVHFIENWFWE